MIPYGELSQLYRALAHPVRLQILDALARGEECVCDLTALLGAPQPYLSQHLAVLRKVGLVECCRRGNRVYYRPRGRCAMEIIAIGSEWLGTLQGDGAVACEGEDISSDCC